MRDLNPITLIVLAPRA